MIDIDCLKKGKELFREYYLKYHNEYDTLIESCKSKVKTKVISKVNSYPINFNLCDVLAHKKTKAFSKLSRKPVSGNYTEHFYDENDKLILSTAFENSCPSHIEVLIYDDNRIAVLSFDNGHFLYKVQITAYSSNVPISYICCNYRKFSGFMMDYSSYTFDSNRQLQLIETSYNRLLTDETDEELLSYDSYVEKCLSDESLLSMSWSEFNLECKYSDNGILSEIRTFEQHFSPDFISCENIAKINEKTALAFRGKITEMLDLFPAC